MTKREICERLIKTRDYLSAYEKMLLKDNCPFDADDLGACADALRDLLLDLAAPDEHFADAGKMMGKRHEEETPPLFTYKDEGQKSPCPQCGQLCVRDMVTGNWWCRTHGSWRTRSEAL